MVTTCIDRFRCVVVDPEIFCYSKFIVLVLVCVRSKNGDVEKEWRSRFSRQQFNRLLAFQFS